MPNVQPGDKAIVIKGKRTGKIVLVEHQAFAGDRHPDIPNGVICNPDSCPLMWMVSSLGEPFILTFIDQTGIRTCTTNRVAYPDSWLRKLPDLDEDSPIESMPKELQTS